LRPIIHSRKHYVQTSLATIVAGAKSDVDLVTGLEAGTQGAVNAVTEGALVKAVYIEEWLRSPEATPGSFIGCLYKNVGGSTPFTTVELAGMGDAENKKNVLYFTQGLVNDTNSIATPLTKGWFKIPKSKQRFGLGDRLIWAIFAQGAIDLVRCGFATYKEYT